LFGPFFGIVPFRGSVLLAAGAPWGLDFVVRQGFLSFDFSEFLGFGEGFGLEKQVCDEDSCSFYYVSQI
jgi:hypothetical protein